MSKKRGPAQGPANKKKKKKKKMMKNLPPPNPISTPRDGISRSEGSPLTLTCIHNIYIYTYMDYNCKRFAIPAEATSSYGPIE